MIKHLNYTSKEELIKALNQHIDLMKDQGNDTTADLLERIRDTYPSKLEGEQSYLTDKYLATAVLHKFPKDIRLKFWFEDDGLHLLYDEKPNL